MDPIHEHVQALTRRHFFGRAALGLGTAALATLTARRAGAGHGRRRAARSAALRAEGEAGHLPVHERRPVADGPVRLQAEDGRAVRQGPARVDPQGPAAHDHDQRPDALPHRAVEVQVRPARQVAAPGSANCCRGPRRSSTTWPSSRRVHTEAINHDPAVTYICTGNQLPGRPASAPGSATASAPMNENLPAFVVMTATWTGRKEAQALYNRLWGSGFLPSKHQGVALRSSGDPVLFLSNPAGRRCRHAPPHARRAGAAQSEAARRRRRSGNAGAHRAVRDGLPHADHRCRNWSTSRTSRSTFSTCTARTSTSRARSRPAACWPGGWSSAACASCRSSTAAGTSTATSPAICRTSAATSIRPATP